MSEAAATPQRLAAEALGSALLLAAVVGSGIMGERLAAGNVGIALLANTAATGAMLFVLITIFAPISGAHFNPVVSAVAASQRYITWTLCAAYVAAQLIGAVIGVAAAHAMFEMPIAQISLRARFGAAQLFSEFVATFGLITTIMATIRYAPTRVAAAVASYIMAAYWFTASTSFANPAVTVARSLSDTFAGIRPIDAPAFILAQFGGAIVAMLLSSWLHARPR
ncbi:MAG TPA: MIP/aquaporin family protein [Burkholderiaceae bacterium]|nr:MIP/aquaporin family protein [Burkholderiaceae bacterium]